jgi:hypothetical protein
LNRPAFGSYQRSTQTLQNYEAGPSVHDDYTPRYVKPLPGKAEYQTRTNGWGFVNASLEAGLPIYNVPESLRWQKVFLYPDDEVEKLNKNLDLLHQWEDLENFTQRAALAHLMLKKLGVTTTHKKGSFGFKERSNCLFFFNTQLLLPDEEWRVRGKGPIDQYAGPCSGFQDIAFLRKYGFHENTELVYFDINPKAIEMKKFIFDNFDGHVESLHSLAESVQRKFPEEEVYTGNIYLKVKALLALFGNNEEEFHREWQRFRQLKRSFVRLNLLNAPAKIFGLLDPARKNLLNVTDIYLGQNELLYGYQEMKQKFSSMISMAEKFPDLMLAGTSVNQVIFLEFAHKLHEAEI